MGLFDIFKKQSVTPTAQMLDEDLFWQIVARSIADSSDQQSQEKILVSELRKLTPHQIIGFRLRTDAFLYETYNSDMWCAAYIMNQGCSDDGFEYFRNWVISRGKDVFFAAKQNPDSLISQIDFVEDDYYEFESFWYVALEAFKKNTGKDLYDFIDYDNFHIIESNYPQFEFTWEEEDKDSMKRICPQLFEKFEEGL